MGDTLNHSFQPNGTGATKTERLSQPGTAYTAVTPCNANSAPSTCPGPGYPANSLGAINLTTGAVSNVAITGAITPKGLIFVP